MVEQYIKSNICPLPWTSLEVDVNGSSTESFLNQMQTSSSAIKGHVRISKLLDASAYVMFTISNITNNTDFQEIEVSKIGGINTLFPDDQDIIVTFARTGDAGTSGTTGSSGAAGSAGSSGSAGSCGSSGSSGRALNPERA